ncbi:MAG TPA: Flp pilus assembly protein CpaB [Myxococcales bacterium]|jgi:pilus assembly protein CpaB|nr:Flp pilus assembly protein CpaB [Myxococcales bacterium]
MLKGKTPLLIAIILGVLAGAFAFTAIKRKEKEVKAGWNLVPVIVANQDVGEGTVITYEMVSQRPIPEQFVTSSVVKPDSASYIVGQKVLVPLQTGDALLWSQFETSKAAEKLSTIVQKKGRALTLDVKSSKMSVGGWVRPNDHIDIIGSFRDPTSGENLAVTLMQNVVVLATGKITGTTNINLIPEGDREYQTVSLLVLPEEAEILSLADDLGNLTFTLRNPEDIDVQEERGRATIQTLLTGERMKALQTLRYRTIQVIRGTETKSGGSAGKAEDGP